MCIRDSITFIVPANGSLIFVINGNVSTDTFSPYTPLSNSGLTVNTSIGGIVAPNSLTQTDIDSGTYFADSVKAYFGNVPALPDVYNRTYGLMFMLNDTTAAGKYVRVSMNATALMNAYDGKAINTNSTILTMGSIYGGRIDYNATRVDIPIFVEG